MDAPIFVESMAAALVDAGMQRMAARVFSAVMASPEAELTPGQIGEQLQVSAGAVSGAVGYLLQAGMVRRRHVPGSRHSIIELADDVWYESLASRNEILERWLAVISDGLDELPDGGPAAQRVEVMRDFIAFIMGELPDMLERWRVHRVERHGF
ncbi:MarR family transcriptional regulator [Tsukamurella sp. 8F]|uniref:GbsR/MarR family transcriptional regulator n=1 Tax=unclassified Tsukamurella TaxID=2633480 RepID=UPI0023B9CD45|nr:MULTISPECIES: MarR family transcriptional regulator [unclassified Tsukamurella]MDF0530617.1 MarR family transcriptional regulator [Tsukamurella sp. 8J]MDF0587818.1 MarR family transcriptional regulator [Tsukamurella sp. 8F]